MPIISPISLHDIYFISRSFKRSNSCRSAIKGIELFNRGRVSTIKTCFITSEYPSSGAQTSNETCMVEAGLPSLLEDKVFTVETRLSGLKETSAIPDNQIFRIIEISG